MNLNDALYDEIESRITWINPETSNLPDHDYLHKFLFSKKFDVFLFLENNSVFYNSDSFVNLKKFLSDVDCHEFVCSPIDSNQYDRLVFKVEISEEYYARALCKNEGRSGSFFVPTAYYYLQYDVSKEWCFLHCPFDHIIFVGLANSAVEAFTSAFKDEFMYFSEMVDFVQHTWGGKLDQIHLDVLAEYKTEEYENRKEGRPPELKTDYSISFGDIDEVE